MTVKEQFSTEEWMSLLKAPLMAGMAIALASPNDPIGMVKEVFAATKAVVESGTRPDASELLQAVVAELKAGKNDELKEEMKIDGSSVEALRAEVASELDKAVTVLNEKASSGDAQDFKQMLMLAAQKAAEAAKEGGFMGIGGEKVNAAEQQALDDLQQKLGL